MMSSILSIWSRCAVPPQSYLDSACSSRGRDLTLTNLDCTHLTSLILMTAECPILCTATTLSPRWQYLSCFATDIAACTCHTTQHQLSLKQEYRVELLLML